MEVEKQQGDRRGTAGRQQDHKETARGHHGDIMEATGRQQEGSAGFLERKGRKSSNRHFWRWFGLTVWVWGFAFGVDWSLLVGRFYR